MVTAERHRWQFAARFRRNAFEQWNPQVHCGSQAAGFEANDAETDMELESPLTQQPH